MSLFISSPKLVGNGHSKSYDNKVFRPEQDKYRIPAYKFKAALLFVILFPGFRYPSVAAISDNTAKSISAKAASECLQKMKKIEEFAGQEETAEKMETRFTEEEINSYLSLDLASNPQSCIRNTRIAFKQDLMESVASVDFDCLKEQSADTFSAIILRLFSGTHVITSRGTIVSGNGEGRIQLEQTRFDESVLPNLLVEEAIAAVCRNQEPPFNPMEPTPLPYKIRKITIHPGYIMVYQ